MCREVRVAYTGPGYGPGLQGTARGPSRPPGRDGPRACSAADGTCHAGLVRGRHRNGPGGPLGTDEGERERPVGHGGDPRGQADRVLKRRGPLARP